MSNKPRRVWQIHLITLVILIVASSGLLGLSLVPQKVSYIKPRVTPGAYFYEQGWPLVWNRTYGCAFPNTVQSGRTVTILNNGLTIDCQYSDGSSRIHSLPYPNNWKGVFVDLSVGILIVVIVAGTSELYLRRREARKP